MATKSVFGRLKSRFRVLHKKCQSDKETLIDMALACIVLHNICIDREDLIPKAFDLRYESADNSNNLYVFDFSFVKRILEVLLMGFYSAKYTCYFFKVTWYNFKTEWLPIPYS